MSGRAATKLLLNGAFCDLVQPLDKKEAEIEASRCYYCYDAPCITACPTGIDIPSFIRKIGNENIRGAAMDILSANIMGGTCSRVCPVETLCQEACVREHSEKEPVKIGELQRYATDTFFKTMDEKKLPHPFTRAKSNGKKVAVVGAGPAGLSCAHELAKFGFNVTVFESKSKAGGLNEYGIAPYKMVDDFAQKEVDFILGIGGIEIEHNKHLGKDIKLNDLKSKFDAVFLGIGLGGNNPLGLENEDLSGVMDATKYIEQVRQAKDLKKLPIGQHVIVIGGGNTAIDVAVQAKSLGAEFVTLVYRRGTEHMGATWHEQEIAQTHGVLIKTWAKPAAIRGDKKGVKEMDFEYTEMKNGKLVGTGKTFTLKADQVFKAIGQVLVQEEGLPEIRDGKIKVNESLETSIPGIYAGGDCIKLGEDLTVTSVQQGKLAARSIHKKLGGVQLNG